MLWALLLGYDRTESMIHFRRDPWRKRRISSSMRAVCCSSVSAPHSCTVPVLS